MTQFLITVFVLVGAVSAVIAGYRLIVSDGGGARRTPLPAEPPDRTLPYPRGRRSQPGHSEDVLAERRRARELRGAQYFGGRLNA